MLRRARVNRTAARSRQILRDVWGDAQHARDIDKYWKTKEE
jgi:hypothetical protein